MNIVLARLQTALAIANKEGDTNAAAEFTAAIRDLTPFARDPFIMPDVLTPPADPVPQVMETPATDPVPASAPETQPSVASDAPVTPDPTSSAPAVDASAPVSSAPEQVAESPAPTDVGTRPVASDGADSGAAAVGGVSSDTTPVPEPVQPVAPQADPADEDPTPADKETIDTLDARIDALEGHPRKVSRP